MTTKMGNMGATSPRAPRKSAVSVKWARRLEVVAKYCETH